MSLIIKMVFIDGLAEIVKADLNLVCLTSLCEREEWTNVDVRQCEVSENTASTSLGKLEALRSWERGTKHSSSHSCQKEPTLCKCDFGTLDSTAQ